MNLANDSYLIRLGFVTDQPGFARFQATLRDASRIVDTRATEVASSLLKWQVAITGGFAAIGTAALGLADKVAQADQEYRLFGLRMYMTEGQAKTLKIAMDALGQPLENIAWDPELRARFNQLVEDQRTMAKGLGGNFEAAMKKIRDVRFELTRLQVEVQYLAMGFAQNIFKAMGIDPDQVLVKLRELNDWIIQHLPEITAWFSDKLGPVFADMRDVLGQTWDLIKLTAVAFTNLIGLLSGDTSLEGTTFNFERMAEALEKVVHWAAQFVETMIHAEEMLLHFLNAAMFGIQAIEEKVTGSGNSSKDLLAARGELKAAAALAGPGSGAISGAVLGGIVGTFTGNPILGAMLGSAVGAGAGGATEGMREGTGPNSGARSSAVIRALLDQASGVFGVDPAIVRAVAMQESGQREFDTSGKLIQSGKGALGVMQLMPGTAKALGVNPLDARENVMGGVELLRQLLDRYRGNMPDALAAYNWNPQGVDKVLAGKATLPDETRNYVASVLSQAGQGGSSVQIGSIHIQIPEPGASKEQIKDAVVAGVRDASDKKIQRNLAEFNSYSYSY